MLGLRRYRAVARLGLRWWRVVARLRGERGVPTVVLGRADLDGDDLALPLGGLAVRGPHPGVGPDCNQAHAANHQAHDQDDVVAAAAAAAGRRWRRRRRRGRPRGGRGGRRHGRGLHDDLPVHHGGRGGVRLAVVGVVHAGHVGHDARLQLLGVGRDLELLRGLYVVLGLDLDVGQCGARDASDDEK